MFRSLNLDVPDTWDDIINLLPALQRYGMNFYHPIAGGISINGSIRHAHLYFNTAELFIRRTG